MLKMKISFSICSELASFASENTIEVNYFYVMVSSFLPILLYDSTYNIHIFMIKKTRSCKVLQPWCDYVDNIGNPASLLLPAPQHKLLILCWCGAD